MHAFHRGVRRRAAVTELVNAGGSCLLVVQEVCKPNCRNRDADLITTNAESGIRSRWVVKFPSDMTGFTRFGGVYGWLKFHQLSGLLQSGLPHRKYESETVGRQSIRLGYDIENDVQMLDRLTDGVFFGVERASSTFSVHPGFVQSPKGRLQNQSYKRGEGWTEARSTQTRISETSSTVTSRFKLITSIEQVTRQAAPAFNRNLLYARDCRPTHYYWFRLEAAAIDRGDMEELCNCFQNTTTPSSVIIGLDRERRRSEIICQPVSGGSCRDPETDGDFFGSFLTAEWLKFAIPYGVVSVDILPHSIFLKKSCRGVVKEDVGEPDFDVQNIPLYRTASLVRLLHFPYISRSARHLLKKV
ncbi:hypothetical protein BKA93DRAFT_843834 [Sparassis latifolia]